MYFNLSYCEFSSRVFIITCSGPEITNLPVKGGEASGGVGTWRIGSGGAFEAIGSVMMGMDGMRGMGLVAHDRCAPITRLKLVFFASNLVMLW
jgi:hypothetical protein